MSIFGWIPTVGEVMSSVACTLTDHDWAYFYSKEYKRKFKVCETCGKKEWA
jgi:hypothetical protein